MYGLSHGLSLHGNLPGHVHWASSVHAALAPRPLKVLSIHHHTTTSTRVEFTEVEGVIALAIDPSMLNLCGNLVVYNSLLVFAYNVYAQLKYILLS